MRALPLFLFLYLASNCLIVRAQNDTSFLSHAINTLEKTNANDPVEKVYLQLDRTKYITGDTIWFKAYNLIGGRHKLSSLSKVVYVELINPQDSVITRRILNSPLGVAWGDISIANSLKTGTYRIRAYTNSMRNASADYFFDKKLQLINLRKKTIALTQKPALAQDTARSSNTAKNIDLQFFPEGGDLVVGIRSKVAVKAINSAGLGVDVEGVVVDSDDHVAAEFKTQHLGMGVFALMPEAGKTYKVKITTNGYADVSTQLPRALERGFTLSVNNSGADSIMVKVATNQKLFAERANTNFYVIGQSGGTAYYTSAGKLVNSVFSTMIAKKRFPSGIVQFTLFSAEGEPLNERVAFILNDDTLKLNTGAIASVGKKRGAVNIAFNAANASGKPVVGSFSVSVVNESRLGINGAEKSSILSYLLLTSDLKGNIEDPDYYFTNPNEQTNADLDLLMLTQGYRRFSWSGLLSDQISPLKYASENSLDLKGFIKTPSGNPVANGRVTLAQTEQGLLMDTTSNEKGEFDFTQVGLYDNTKVVLNAKTGKGGKGVQIFIKKPDYPSTITLPLGKSYIEKQLEESALFSDTTGLPHDGARYLDEVKIKAYRQARADKYNAYGTKNERMINMKNLYGYPSLKDALLSTQQVALNLDPAKVLFKFRNIHKTQMQVILDGVLWRFDDLDSFLPEEIESVDIIYDTGTNDPSYLEIFTKRYAGTDTTVLKEVAITGKKISHQPLIANSANLNGPGMADQIIMGDKLSDCIDLSDCLNGKVFGVSFKNGRPYNNRIPTQSRAAMIVIIDGVVESGSHLNDLPSNDIYSIEILRSGAYLSIYGTNAPAGAFVITTKRGANQETYLSTDAPEGTITYQFSGFYKARMFYSPKYGTDKSLNGMPDLRTTIYWNPNIITDENGKGAFNYFNADTKGTYRVMIEGIDTDGNLGRKTYLYEIK